MGVAAEVTRPRTLMLIPSSVAPDTKAETVAGRRPTADYFALQESLQADILDYGSVANSSSRAVARIARSAGNAAALAALGYSRVADYDIIFSNAENVGIVFGMLTRSFGSRGSAAHVMIGHRLSSPKKRMMLRLVRSQIDRVLLYSDVQRVYAEQTLGFVSEQLIKIPFHADHRFFECSDAVVNPRQVCSAGLEWRDYPTLVRAVNGLDVQVRIGAYSPWSTSPNELTSCELPPNVEVARYDYAQLKQLYAESAVVVTPLKQTDFQAGITSIIEGMSMGKPVVATGTRGLPETIVSGTNGLLTRPGDVEGLRHAILSVLDNGVEAARLGARARTDVESILTLDHWVDRISQVVRGLFAERSRSVK